MFLVSLLLSLLRRFYDSDASCQHYESIERPFDKLEPKPSINLRMTDSWIPRHWSNRLVVLLISQRGTPKR
jgi:hypothetical protein